MAVICLACGDALKVKERCLLDSDSSKHVLPVWRFFFEAKLQELGLSEEVDVDGLVRDLVYGSGDDSKAGRVCRTCFSALERYDKLRKSIDMLIHVLYTGGA